MRTLRPLGEYQVGPRREIRFKTDPLSIPGETINLVLAPKVWSLIVKVELLGDNGYAKGEVVGKCKKAKKSSAATI